MAQALSLDLRRRVVEARRRNDPPPGGTAVWRKPLERDPLGSAIGKLG
jgi:hypothetical protein